MNVFGAGHAERVFAFKKVRCKAVEWEKTPCFKVCLKKKKEKRCANATIKDTRLVHLHGKTIEKDHSGMCSL